MSEQHPPGREQRGYESPGELWCRAKTAEEKLRQAEQREAALREALTKLAEYEQITIPCDDTACWECRSVKIARAALSGRNEGRYIPEEEE
jgi:hypothetical protein